MFPCQSGHYTTLFILHFNFEVLHTETGRVGGRAITHCLDVLRADYTLDTSFTERKSHLCLGAVLEVSFNYNGIVVMSVCKMGLVQ